MVGTQFEVPHSHHITLAPHHTLSHPITPTPIKNQHHHGKEYLLISAPDTVSWLTSTPSCWHKAGVSYFFLQHSLTDLLKSCWDHLQGGKKKGIQWKVPDDSRSYILCLPFLDPLLSTAMKTNPLQHQVHHCYSGNDLLYHAVQLPASQDDSLVYTSCCCVQPNYPSLLLMGRRTKLFRLPSSFRGVLLFFPSWWFMWLSFETTLI